MQPAIVAMAALCGRQTGQIIVGVDGGGDSDGVKMSSSELQMQKRRKEKKKTLFSFFPSATHKEEKRGETKRLRSISPIRNRLQIKLWKFSGSVAFEVCRQKTEERLFLEHYYLFAPFLSLLFVFFLYFPNKDRNDDLIMITLPLRCAQTLPFTHIWGKDWC